MTEQEHRPIDPRPVLLCFDGSENAAAAIALADRLLRAQSAVVLTVWEPVAVWEPYDPAILSAPMSKLASKALDLDPIAEELAQEKMARGLGLAREAGFQARGKPSEGQDLKDHLPARRRDRRGEHRGGRPWPLTDGVDAAG